jgi:nicotinate-nucleotide adenylyltransferase
MGGAALGTDVTTAQRPIVSGSLGVFGGTFDPIHVAHLAVAEEAAEALGLERILFMPAGQPPHKPGLEITPAEQRLAMVELAIAGNERFAVDRREIERDGPSYTVDTLEDLSASRLAEGARPDLTLVLSAEAFLGLMTWREPRRVMELARVAVAPRDGYPDAGPDLLATHLPDLADRATFLDGPRLRLSASDLRARAAAGRSLRYLVPDAVAAYIGDHGLYQHTRRDPPS